MSIDSRALVLDLLCDLGARRWPTRGRYGC